MTDGELQNLRTAFSKLMKLKNDDNRSYAHFAGIHGFPDDKCWHEPRDMDGWPQVHLFLPWHRAYLYYLEKALQDQLPGVTIPFWDWRSSSKREEKIPKALSEKTISGEANPLYKFYINYPDSGITRDTRRYPGQFIRGQVDLPSPEEVEQVLGTPDNHFEDFSESLRNIHNRVHLWTGGSTRENGTPVQGDMAVVPFAAFDPIFFIHHCTIDRLWWLWQKKNGIDEIPNYYKPMALAPFEDATVQNVLDIYTLGYDYAEDSLSLEGEWK
jgi:tyrosinase